MQVDQEELLSAAAPALMIDVLARHGRVHLRALGSSMVPAIRSGDVLCIERCAAADARPGDILLMRQGDERIIAHRLLGTDGRDEELRFVTRGDALRHTEPPRPASMLLGRVVGISRKGSAIAVPRRITRRQRVYGLMATETARVSRVFRAWLAPAYKKTAAAKPLPCQRVSRVNP